LHRDILREGAELVLSISVSTSNSIYAGYIQHLLKSYFGSLIRAYVIDVTKTNIIVSPKNHLLKVTFRGSNCSYA
jgi:hypothetical protein